MSVWQYAAAMDGYVAAHVPEKPEGDEIADPDSVWAWLQTKSDKVQ